MSFTLKNCKILVNGKYTTTTLFVDKGIIQHIGHAQDADEVIDLHNKLLMPGLIDSHVHFREPGLTHKEDFFSGSCSAVAGGVTTFIDMPNTLPPTTTTSLLKKKRQLAVKSIANYGFHFGSMENNLAEIKKVKNVASVKVYMNETTGNLKLDNKTFLQKVFDSYPRITVHAEDTAVDLALQLTKKNMLYVCHLPGKKELQTVLSDVGKKKVYLEVTPHHLFLTKHDAEELGAFGIMKPPLGTDHDVKALWKAVVEGNIHTLGTDHAPHTIEEKNVKSPGKPPYGVPGLETMLPLLLNAVHEKKISLDMVHELCCYNPSAIFGIQNKGKIAVGYDADLTVVDMDLVKEVQNELLFTKCKWSPFNGWKLRGWPVMTFVNGNLVYQDGEIYAAASGKEVKFKS